MTPEEIREENKKHCFECSLDGDCLCSEPYVSCETAVCPYTPIYILNRFRATQRMAEWFVYKPWKNKRTILEESAK